MSGVPRETPRAATNFVYRFSNIPNHLTTR